MARILHLGCGLHKHLDSICVDLNPWSDADVLCDLNQFPYPFARDSFDRIICVHVLEHLDDIIRVVEEIVRVARPGAILTVEVPHFSSVYFHQDPTHKHAFTSRTFDYFIPGKEVWGFHYSTSQLDLIYVEFPPPSNAGNVKKIIFRWINQNIDFYEKHLAYIIPRHLLRFELKVVK